MDVDFETRCIHGDPENRLRDGNHSVSFPIYQTSSFSHVTPGHNLNGFDYTRESNPTRTRLEQVVASLEGAENAIAFASGMAAISAVFELFSPGDHVVCSADLYGGVTRLHALISRKNGVAVTYADTEDPAALEAAVCPETKAVYVESPSNPTMRVTDLRAVAEIARAHGLLFIVDNTFLSPYYQNPLGLGADLVVHSGSKFLAGHNDTIAGFLCVKDPELAGKLRLIAKTTGGALAPFDSWLVLRGVKTLAIRMDRQQENALKLARWLKEQPQVREVYYVGLPEHPGYKTNLAQARGFGSMISFRVDAEETALRVLENVRLITFAESLGGTESLLTYPMVQTHPDVPKETRERLGITATLLRLSVGLEGAEDLIADLGQALEG